MRKLAFMFLFFIFVSACSSEEAGNVAMDQSVEVHDYGFAQEMDGVEESSPAIVEDDLDEPIISEDAVTNRKVIYTADMSIEVKSFEAHSDHIQKETTRLGGYVVESTLYNDQAEGLKSGHMMVRIPQEQFQAFIEIVEKGSTRVVEQTVSGQDVTEEFVDLESRLKSKRQVEERLLEFLANAEKTEDLLTISNDLAKVQEEIEMIIGRMNYLQDKTDYSTVTIYIYENGVTLSSIQEDDLNTWEETKKQFMRSINFIITAFSGLVVFFVGNLPLIILFGFLAIFVYLLWKRYRK